MNLKETTGIYTITNKITGDCYVGSTTVSFYNRRRDHFKNLRKGSHHSIKLQRAFNKYGEESFKFEILQEIDIIDVIPSLEQYWMNLISPKYNMLLSVRRNGAKHTYETTLKMSRIHGGRDFQAYKDGILVGTYKMQKEACKDLGVQQSKISKCLSGERKHTKGYRFKYVGEDFKYFYADKQEKYWKSLKGRTVSVNKKRGTKIIDLDNQVCFYSIEDARKFRNMSRTKFDNLRKNNMIKMEIING